MYLSCVCSYFDGDPPEEDKLKIKIKSEDEEDYSQTATKDETPDSWDDDEQQQQEQLEEKEEKEKLRRQDKDLEFLFQDVVRDGSLDDSLMTDLQNKKTNPKYKEMLVSITFLLATFTALLLARIFM